MEIRHTGIYVDDIETMEKFYIHVFDMHIICSQEPDEGELFDELLGTQSAKILTSKLVTPYGKKQGQGDMIELVKVVSEMDSLPRLSKDRKISVPGMMHIALGIYDMDDTLSRIITSGGEQKTKVTIMKNGNKCCFCVDPEGNWLELIQRGNK